MREHAIFICNLHFGEEKGAELRAEARAAGLSFSDYIKRLTEQNAHLIFGEDMGE